MTETCAYHAGQPALDSCAQCEKPICNDCRDFVAGKPVCRPCVAAIRARVSQTMTPPSATGTSVMPGMEVSGGAYVPPPPMPGGVYAPPSSVATPGIGRLLLGILLGFFAGVAGSIAWFALVVALKIDFSLFAVGVGWIIGFALVKGSGRGGLTLAIIAGVLSIIFCGGTSLLLDGGKITILGVVFAAIGIYTAVMVPLRQAG